MGILRLYRQIYLFSGSGSTLIDPYFLSASTFSATTLTPVVESFPTPTQESTGVFYVDLDSSLYSVSSTYDLNWSIQYLPNTPTKILPTRFIMPITSATTITNVFNIGNQIEVELGNANQIEIEIGNI